jgi:predicted metal-dependent hydrolase
MLKLGARPATERTASLGGRTITFRVRVSRTATRARINVGPAGLEIVVPPSKPESFAEAFLAENEAWVLAQLEAAERLGGVRKPNQVVGPGILLRGKQAPVSVEWRDGGALYPIISEQGGRVFVSARQGQEADLSAALSRWLRSQARAVIVDRVALWSEKVGAKPGRVFIRSQKTKWGNCSAAGNLSLNWRLIMAPPRTLDAIVIHELVHLTEPTHQARFWLLLRSHCPTYDRDVRWLAENESRVFATPILPDRLPK